MKPFVLFAIFAAAFTVTASTPLAHAADAKDFPIKVHVYSSELKPCSAYFVGITQCLGVLIDGKKYELSRDGRDRGFPIHTGDYQARLTRNKEKDAGQFDREYEFIFSDGKTEFFWVIGEFE